MNFLIIGLGSIGKRHMKILKNLGDHKVIALRTGKAKKTEQHDNEIKADSEIESYSQISDYEIDAALITNPTSLHTDTAIEIAKQGIPIFIEKPLGKNTDRTDKLLKIVNEKNIPVMMGYNLIFHPCIREMKKLIQEGKIGKVISAKAQFGTYMPGWHKNEDYKKSYAANTSLGGGAVLTSIHEQNYLTYFFGGVTDVKAMGTSGNAIEIDAEEGVEILLKHQTGVLSNIHLNFFQKPYYRNCQIIGTEGTLYWDFRIPEVKILTDEKTEVVKKGNDYIELLDTSYTEQMKHFIEAVKGNKSPEQGLEQGIADLKVALKILKEIGRN